jgi:Cu-processing system permease protein
MLSIIAAVAANSWKQFVRDRIFYVVLIMAMLMLGFSYLLATLTFVESRKILLDFGFSAMSLSGVLTATYIGIVAVAREIEQRTIYSVITKPVSRQAYLVGKFIGAALVLAVTHLLMAFTIWGILYELGEGFPSGLPSCFLLIYLENLVVLATAFLCSAFSSSVLAGGLTIAFFLIGRSNPSFAVMSEKAQTGGVKLVAKALYYSMPNFERFNIRDVVAYDRPFPPEMIWIGVVYAAAYVLVCLSASSLVIRGRDLP